MACLALCVSACGDPEPIAAEQALACGTDGERARLRFAGPAGTADEERRLAFILGLPDLHRGETGKESPTNVTLMEEGTGRFFGTRDTVNCWTDVAPLADLNGNLDVSVTDITFTGHMTWDKPK